MHRLDRSLAAARLTLVALFATASLGLAACSESPSSSPIVVPDPEPTQSVAVDAEVPESEDMTKRVCNFDGSCCCWRDRYGEIRCTGRCQTP